MALEERIFKDIAGEVLLLPIRVLSVEHIESEVRLHFYQISQESSYVIDPITKQNDRGQIITVAYKIALNIVLANNKLQNERGSYSDGDLIQELERLNNKSVWTNLILGDDESAEWDLEPSVRPTGDIVIPKNASDYLVLNFADRLLMTYKLTQSEYRPSITIILTGIVRNISSVKTENHYPTNQLYN